MRLGSTFLSVPFLAAPTQTFIIDDAGASATASRVIVHGGSVHCELAISSAVIRN